MGDTSRGLDGLTAEELRASRQQWWDDRFTRHLLSLLPPDPRHILDVGCGVATAAHALLPHLARATYVGIDPDERRLEDAAKLLRGAPYRDRAELRRADAAHLPCADDSCDAVLSSMTLQHLPDVAAALEEIRRVLRPGRRLIAVEPDNLDNRFYFDGPLEDVNAACRALFAARRRQRRPADIAVGPSVPSALERSGFTDIECHPYLIGRARRLAAGAFFDGARHAVAIAAGSADGQASAELAACTAAIDRAQAAVGPDRIGYGAQTVPVFITVGTKPVAP